MSQTPASSSPLLPASITCLRRRCRIIGCCQKCSVFHWNRNMQKTKQGVFSNQPWFSHFWENLGHKCSFLLFFAGEKIHSPTRSIYMHFQLSTMLLSSYQYLGIVMDGETQRKPFIGKMICGNIIFYDLWLHMGTCLKSAHWHGTGTVLKCILPPSMEMILVPGYPLLALMR